jgi:hypothetical protein
MSATSGLATVTVTYPPRPRDPCVTQLSQLPSDALRIVVDNASPEAASSATCAPWWRTLGVETHRKRTTNLGLAAATNVGICPCAGSRCGARACSSTRTPSRARAVLRAFVAKPTIALRASDPRPPSLGPRLGRRRDGHGHTGFTSSAAWLLGCRCAAGTGRRCDVRSIARTSTEAGHLVPRDILDALGGLDSRLLHRPTSIRNGPSASLRLALACIARARRGVPSPDGASGTWRFWSVGMAHLARTIAVAGIGICSGMRVRLMRRSYVPPVWNGTGRWRSSR